MDFADAASLLVKISVPAILVGLMSLAARRLGPTIGGLLVGLPWMTGPVLLILTLEKGPAFGIRLYTGAILAVLGIAAWASTYSRLARSLGWPLALATGLAAFAAAAVVLARLEITLAGAAALGYCGLTAAHLLMPRPTLGERLAGLPWWDIPVRMAATLLLAAGIVFAAEVLGPQLAGIVGSYPVILTVLTTFTHAQWGVEPAQRLLRSVLLSLTSFVTFFLVAGLLVEDLGTIAAFTVATLAALAWSGALLWLVRAGIVR
jgi:hypothetical protein